MGRVARLFRQGVSMKKSVIISISVFLGFLSLILAVIFSGTPEHDPKDLSYWVQAGANKDWSTEAAQGKPEAQFFLGLTLIRTNLTKFVERVPVLSKVP